MSSAPVRAWTVVGTFYKRPVPQGQVVDFTREHSRYDDDDACDAPILLYDMKSGDEERQYRVPRYLARKIPIPPPATQTLKVVSVAPPRIDPTKTVKEEAESFNIDCDEPVFSSSHQQSQAKRKKAIVVGTLTPGPSHLSFLLPFIIVLGDVALLVACLATEKPRRELIAAYSLLVLVPDFGTLVILIKRGLYSITFAIHLLIWPNVVLLFLLPYIYVVFVLHLLLTLLMVIYCLRFRRSTHISFIKLR